MTTIFDPNIDLLEKIVEQLGDMADEMVFVGGCVTGILITDSAAPPVRRTVDVDVIAEVTSRVEYYQLSDKLREKGFHEDMLSGIICRWKNQELVLDIIPVDESILGFGSKWFKSAYENAEKKELPSGKEVSVITAPYYLACKLVAFENRGKDDYLMSKDIQDVISIIDGRSEIIEEIGRSQEDLKEFLTKKLRTLSNNREFNNNLPGQLDRASQDRIPIIKNRIKTISELL